MHVAAFGKEEGLLVSRTPKEGAAGWLSAPTPEC